MPLFKPLAAQPEQAEAPRPQSLSVAYAARRMATRKLKGGSMPLPEAEDGESPRSIAESILRAKLEKLKAESPGIPEEAESPAIPAEVEAQEEVGGSIADRIRAAAKRALG